MPSNIPEEEFDAELINDYREGYDDHYEIIINCIAILEANPDNDETIDELFRAFHTVKGNARMLMFEELANFLHSVEESISLLREHKIIFTELLGEAITLCLDKAKEISEAIFSQTTVDDPSIQDIQDTFTQMQSCQQQEVDLLCAQIIKLITGFDIDVNGLQGNLIDINTETDEANITEQQNHSSTYQTEMVQEMVFYVANDAPNNHQEQLGYFRYLTLLLETKFPHWQGRAHNCKQLLLTFNKTLDKPVPDYQLEMASYLHDIGFAFLPDKLMLGRNKFTKDELTLMQTHTQIAADLIAMDDKWKIAHDIVLHHHERADGNGYPDKLTEEKISIGAKMLCIVDAFIAMTAFRPDRQYKRSVLTALNEIKSQAGKQFSAELAPVFIKLIVNQLK